MYLVGLLLCGRAIPRVMALQLWRLLVLAGRLTTRKGNEVGVTVLWLVVFAGWLCMGHLRNKKISLG